MFGSRIDPPPRSRCFRCARIASAWTAASVRSDRTFTSLLCVVVRQRIAGDVVLLDRGLDARAVVEHPADLEEVALPRAVARRPRRHDRLMLRGVLRDRGLGHDNSADRTYQLAAVAL